MAIHEKGVRVRFIGEWPNLLNKGVVKLMRRAEAETAMRALKDYAQRERRFGK